MKSVYLCTRKTRGTVQNDKERVFAKVLWENDPSKVWKVRVQEYEKERTLSIQKKLDKSESRQKFFKQDKQITKKSLILAQDER